MNEDWKKGNYYFVSLHNLDEEFVADPCPGYYNLIQELLRCSIFPRLMVLKQKKVVEKIDEIVNDLVPDPEMEEMFASVGLSDALAPKLVEVIRARYLSGTSSVRSLRSSGEEINLSGERVRQLEKKALRRLKHKYRSNQIRDLMHEELFEKYENTRDTNYASYLEMIIEKEISLFKKTGKDTNLIFKEIIYSPRFDVVDENNRFFSEIIPNSIDDIDLTSLEWNPETNCFEDRVIEAEAKSSCSYPKYKLDSHTIFIIPGEIPLTRCGLQGELLFRLLSHGFFYVSDFTKYYDEISYNPGEKHKAYKKERISESDSIKELLDYDEKIFLKQEYYEEPLLRIKISSNLEERMHEKGIITESELKDNISSFTSVQKKEIEIIFDEIDRARKEINKTEN